MGGAEEEIYEERALGKDDGNGGGLEDQWGIGEGGDDRFDTNSIGSYSEDSADSNASSSSSDMMEDATSSTSSSSNSYDGPLFELSDLMAQLPIKRGLSKYYQGKSQTFASLESVKSIEDLAKIGTLPKRRKMMKSSKSYGGGLDRQIYSPKATISKKNSRVSLVSSLGGGRRGTLFFSSCGGTSIPLPKNLQ